MYVKKPQLIAHAAAGALALALLAAPLPIWANDEDLVHADIIEVDDGPVDDWVDQEDTVAFAAAAEAMSEDDTAVEVLSQSPDAGHVAYIPEGGWEALKAAVEDAAIDTIVLAGDVTLGAKLSITRDLTFKAMDGKDSVRLYSADGQRHIGISTHDIIIAFENVILDGRGSLGGMETTASLTIKNVQIENTSYASGGAALRIVPPVDAPPIDVVIEGGRFVDNVTTISGSVTAGVGGGAIHVKNGNVTLKGPMLVAGNRAEASNGGAIYLYENSTLAIGEGVTFEDNIAKAGGAIYWYRSEDTSHQPHLALSGNTTFVDNRATTASGGAIHTNYSLSVGDGVRFTDNYAGTSGGAIYVERDLTISGDVIFSTNSSGLYGGAVYANANTTAITGDVRFLSNESIRGGAYYSTGDTTIKDGVLFSGNTALPSTGYVKPSGGAIAALQHKRDGIAYGSLVLSGVTLTDNRSDEWGGGIYSAAQTQIHNTIIKGNRAQKGGGICMPTVSVGIDTFTGSLSLSHVTLDDNTAFETGGAMYTVTDVVAEDTVFTNNTASSGGAVYTSKLEHLKTAVATFRDNRADTAYLWALSGADGALHTSNIRETTYTAPFTNAYNNADVNYTLAGSQVYIVAFDSQGGSEVASQGVAPGAHAVKPGDPARSNYIFGGWYRDAACIGDPWRFDTDTVDGNMTLFAQWTSKGTTSPPPTSSGGGDGDGDSGMPVTPDPIPGAVQPPLADLPDDEEPLPGTGAVSGGMAHAAGLLVGIPTARYLNSRRRHR